MNKYIINVFNSATGNFEDVEVTEAVYNAYRRSGWNMDKNDAKHSANSTPFSSLIGGDNGTYENFSEFVSETDNPLFIVSDKLARQSLHRALNILSDEETALITALFFEEKTERQYADEIGVFRNAVHKKKVRILKKNKNFIDI